MNSPSIAKYLQQDPLDFFRGLNSLAIVKRITYQSATQTIGTIPANSIILTRRVVRLTKWDAVTTFEVGKAGDTDWLVSTAQANVTGNIPVGEDAGVEEITGPKVVTAATDIVVTLNQGAAAQGVSYVIVEYQEMVR